MNNELNNILIGNAVKVHLILLRILKRIPRIYKTYRTLINRFKSVPCVHKARRKRLYYVRTIPYRLKDYIGQPATKQIIETLILRAKESDRPMDHILLLGPRGLGKTTLAHIIAVELGVHIHQYHGDYIEKPDDFTNRLSNLKPKTVLLIDEIARLKPDIIEILCQVLKNHWIDTSTAKLDIAPFTLVGATARESKVSPYLWHHFHVIQRLVPYNTKEIVSIIEHTANQRNISIDKVNAYKIANRSRGKPRRALSLLHLANYYAKAQTNNTIEQGNIIQAIYALKLTNRPRGTAAKTVSE